MFVKNEPEFLLTRLVPVIELSPWDYQSVERPAPVGSVDESPQEWQRFWQLSLQDAGITAPAPHPNAGSFFIKVEDVTESSLITKLVRQAFESDDLPIDDADIDDINETLAPFSGGFVLETGEHCVAPQCCCGLADLCHWQDFANWTSEEWCMVWIGHPCIYGRRISDSFEISSLTDEMAKPEDIKPAFAVPVQSLQAAVLDAERIVHDLRERIIAILDTHFSDRKRNEAIARTLTSTTSQPDDEA